MTGHWIGQTQVTKEAVTTGPPQRAVERAPRLPPLGAGQRVPRSARGDALRSASPRRGNLAPEATLTVAPWLKRKNVRHVHRDIDDERHEVRMVCRRIEDL